MIEWNGIPLTGISHDEVSRIIANQIGDEIEVVIRTDVNLLSDVQQQPYGQQYGQQPGGNQMMMGPNYDGRPPPPGPYGPQQGPQGPYGPQQGQPPPGSYGPVEGGKMPPPSAYNYGPQHQQQQAHHMMPPGGNPQGMSQHPPGAAYGHQPQKGPMMGHGMMVGGHPPPHQGHQMMMGQQGQQGGFPYHQQSQQNQQPQVILQHNHPVTEDHGYDQYGHPKHGPQGPPIGSQHHMIQSGLQQIPLQGPHQHQQMHPQQHPQQMDSGLYTGSGYPQH